ncbi:hypothetical protein K3G63_19650 [Hymenobacter sp. HSC-4F20]|uniref:hypothetical protein n=1 Tax=Hymenobacter sp. HSC-4F20 TaxID=2864135 RepID=UPI001C7345BF|nr:hypothetical protein [Hymenobacter sp. HSC-4F20]MBX0292669.1 hypothetical protein [Hymenobacter sp. HSC-4F20]
MKSIRSVLLVAAIGLGSCAKEQKLPSPSLTKEELAIADSNWRLVGYLYEATPKAGGPTTTINYFPRLTCEKDDLYGFKSDNQLIWIQGNDVWAGNPAGSAPWATWQITANNAQLPLNRNGENYFHFNRNGRAGLLPAFDIVRLTADDLVLKNNVVRAADSVITIT